MCTLHPKTPHAHAYGPSTVDAFGVPLSDSAGIGDHNYCRNLRYPNTWSPINPEECNRTYSSVWVNDACGVGYAQSMLDSDMAWSSGTIEGDIWMTIDAGGSVMDVHGVRVQKRKDAPDQYVTQFTVQHSTDGASFSDVDGGAVFDGPTVANGADDYIDAEFAAPVSARYIRITVQEYNSFPSMRAGLLASVPPGDARYADDLAHAPHVLHYHTSPPPLRPPSLLLVLLLLLPLLLSSPTNRCLPPSQVRT